VLLAQSKIPSLDEMISAMIQEDNRIGLHTGIGELSWLKSALVAANTSNTRYKVET
jgi:hypothetical protein